MATCTDFNGGRRGDLVDVVFERYAFSTFREVRQWLYSEGWLTAGAAHEPPAMRVIELVDLPCAPPAVPIPETKGIVHVYRWADGSIPLLVHRFTGGDGHKIIRRQTWDPEKEAWYRRWNDEKHKWEWGTSTNARLPLYGLLPMLANPDSSVLIVEGEKTARAGELRWPGLVTISPCGGSNPAWGTDWSPLAGRRVQVLGDADASGLTFSRKVEYFAKEAGGSGPYHPGPCKGLGQLGRLWTASEGLGYCGRSEVVRCQRYALRISPNTAISWFPCANGRGSLWRWDKSAGAAGK